MTAIYSTKTYQENDGRHRGIVVGIDDRPVIWTELTYLSEENARRYAWTSFEDALYKCDHKWSEWKDHHSEDTAEGMTEYVCHSDCENCGLRNWSVSDKPQY